jgi:ferredoxin
MKKNPVIDLADCTDCESCVEICPAVFRKNKETDCIEVVDLEDYPEECVQEAIKMCPADCISWEKE